jgi:hypothetical protein
MLAALWLSDAGLKIVAQFCACRPCSRHLHGPLKETPATQANHLERERLEDERKQLEYECRRLEDESIDNAAESPQPIYDDNVHMDEPWPDNDTVMNEPILPTNTCDLSIEMSEITLFISPIAQFLFEDKLNRKCSLAEDLYIDRFVFFHTIPDPMFTESFYTDVYLPMHIDSPVFHDDSSSDTSSDSDGAFVYNALMTSSLMMVLTGGFGMPASLSSSTALPLALFCRPYPFSAFGSSISLSRLK